MNHFPSEPSEYSAQSLNWRFSQSLRLMRAEFENGLDHIQIIKTAFQSDQTSIASSIVLYGVSLFHDFIQTNPNSPIRPNTKNIVILTSMSVSDVSRNLINLVKDKLLIVTRSDEPEYHYYLKDDLFSDIQSLMEKSRLALDDEHSD
jgi:hypothetical protein